MIRRLEGRYLVEGSVTLDSVCGLLAEGLGSFEGNRVVVDLSGVVAADSSLPSLMLEWQRRLRLQGREIAFARLGANLASLTQLYGIADLIPVAAE